MPKTIISDFLLIDHFIVLCCRLSSWHYCLFPHLKMQITTLVYAHPYNSSWCCFKKHITGTVKFQAFCFCQTLNCGLNSLCVGLLKLQQHTQDLCNQLPCLRSSPDEWICSLPGHMPTAKFPARASFNPAFHFHGTSAAVTQSCAPLPLCSEAAQPAWSPSLEEVNLRGLMKTVLGRPGCDAVYVPPAE